MLGRSQSPAWSASVTRKVGAVGHQRVELQLIGEGLHQVWRYLSLIPSLFSDRQHAHSELVSCCILGTTPKMDTLCPGARCLEQTATATLESIREAVLDRVGAAVIVIDEQGAVSCSMWAQRGCSASQRAHMSDNQSRTCIGEPAPDQPDPAAELDYCIASSEHERWLRGSWSLIDPGEGDRNFSSVRSDETTRERNLQRDLVRSAALAEPGPDGCGGCPRGEQSATYLMTNLSILRDDLAGEVVDVAAASEFIEECLDGVTRITDVVKRMRSLASSGSEEIGDALIDLSTVVRDACRIAGLRVKYKADLHIHDAETVQVRGSSKRLGQVILNLVVNAADALTGQSDPLPRIDVSVETEPDYGVVVVRDNGPGVPEDKRASIFEAFVTSKSSNGGTGLGLAVSQTIAEEHGGTLSLEAGVGQGAVFKLRLPLPKP